MVALSASDGPPAEKPAGGKVESSAAVVVPATSANLGCAFDCAGIALNLYLRARATLTASPGLAVVYRGVDSARIPLDDGNLVVQAIERATLHCEGILPGRPSSRHGLLLELDNDIPIGVGLGSSAAAILAGVVLGSELCSRRLEAAELLRIAMEIENHPDNLATAIHGGMVVAALSEAASETALPGAATPAVGVPGVLVARAPVSDRLDFVAVIPDTPLPTAEARMVLPDSYSRQDVVANLQHAALLTAAFFSGGKLSPELFRDHLHQPYRSGLVPGIADCLAYRHPGLLGVFLSGAGSAVMAIVDAGAGHPPASRQIADDLIARFQKNGTAARALLLKADNAGTRISTVAGERLLSCAASP